MPKRIIMSVQLFVTDSFYQYYLLISFLIEVHLFFVLLWERPRWYLWKEVVIEVVKEVTIVKIDL